MELKDVILSTLAEMEDNETTKEILTNTVNKKEEIKKPEKVKKSDEQKPIENQTSQVAQETTTSLSESELTYLNSLRERLLVLFEGFQAPNNTNLEAKIDLTLNFLEYVLSSIDNRIQKLEKQEKGNINEPM